MRKIYRLFIVLAILPLAGCATIFQGTTQSVTVRVVNAQTDQLVPGATCQITTGDGRVININSNPGVITVSKGQGAINVVCQKAGYQQQDVGVGSKFSKTSLVNVLFWPGFIVDAATGAITHYPSGVTVRMVKK